MPSRCGKTLALGRGIAACLRAEAVALQRILGAAFRLAENRLLGGLERCLPDRKSEVVRFLQCPESKEVLMRIGESFIGWSRGKARAAFAVCLVFLATSAGAQFVVDGVSFTTVPPAGDYELGGLVMAMELVGVPFVNPTKHFQGKMRPILSELAAQAKTMGCQLVVITETQELKDYLIVLGTAIRPGRGGASASAPSKGAGAPITTEEPQAVDPISGTWVGKILEVGEKEPYDITVGLFKDPSSGTYSGAYTVSDPGCQVNLIFDREEGGTYYFTGKNQTHLRCMTFSGATARLIAPDQLEFKILKGLKGQKLHMQGTLKRQ